MEEIIVTEKHVFPPKPTFESMNYNSVVPSLVSLILFIVAFYYFFDSDIEFTLVLVAAVFIHESGHLLAMKFFNYTDLKMFFIPLLGAFVSGNKTEISQNQRAVILLAGPVPGIIIGLVLFFIAMQTNNDSLYRASMIFLFLNVFNLLPISPLDGGNLVSTLFMNKSTTLQTIFLIVSIIALIFIAFRLETYIFLIVPFFLLLSLRNRIKTKAVQKDLEAENISYSKNFDELTDEEYWRIREKVIADHPVFKTIDGKIYEPDMREKQIAGLIKSVLGSKILLDLTGTGKFIYTIVWLIFLLGPAAVYMFLYE
ncbi:MAG: site-2 protease family protein [Fimbriimonadaceae bacterium]|nr:site-2 protease family protein [Chitinophagales bacterium]